MTKLLERIDPQVYQDLLVRPVQEVDESDLGYMLRLANCNGLRRADWLLLGSNGRCHGLQRVCANCLAAEDPYWKSCWLFSDSPWCQRHLRWLADNCPRCGQPFRWKSVRLLECKCGLDLRAITQASLSESMQRCIQDDHASPKVLMWLGAFSIYGPAGKPLKKASSKQVDATRNLLERGAEIATNWPSGFMAQLERWRLNKQSDGVAQLTTHAFPGFARMLKRIGDPVWRERIERVLHDYVRETQRTETPLIQRASLSNPVLTSQTRAAADLGVRLETIQSAMSRGKVTCLATRHTPGGRVRRVFNEKDIQSLSFAISDPIGLKPAARLLGLNVRRIRDLAFSGRIEIKADRVSRRDVEALSAAILDVAEIQDLPLPMQPIRYCFRRWIHSSLTTSFLDGLVNRELRCVRSADCSTLGDVMVAEESVIQWLALRKTLEHETYTVVAAASVMNEKQQVVYDLLDSGLLEGQTRKVNGRLSRTVTCDAINRFQRDYVSLAALATQYGISSRYAYKWSHAQGVSAVTGPDVDGRRKYFVRTRDIHLVHIACQARGI